MWLSSLESNLDADDLRWLILHDLPNLLSYELFILPILDSILP